MMEYYQHIEGISCIQCSVDHSEVGSHIVWYKVTVSELSAASVLRVKHPDEISAFISCFGQL
jgi:hypothetical protein